MNKRQHKKMMKHTVRTKVWVKKDNDKGITILEEKPRWIVMSPRQLTKSKSKNPISLWRVAELSRALQEVK